MTGLFLNNMSEKHSHPSVKGIVEGLSHDYWIHKSGALQDATALLAEGALSRDDEAILLPHIMGTTSHEKWEVRKAAASALAELRHVEVMHLEKEIARLTSDPNPWVRESAMRALRVSRARALSSNDWPLSGDARDPTLNLIAAQIQRIGLRTLTPAEIYELANMFGEHFYGMLAADTAHEVMSILAPLDGYLVQLDEHLSWSKKKDPSAERYLSQAMGRVKQLAALVKDLRVYSSPPASTFERVALAAVANDAVLMGFGQGTDDPVTINIEIDVPTGIALDMMRDRLTRALANLVSNACQAMPRGGTLKFSAREITGTGTIQISVSDNGLGMTPKEIVKAMDRFSSTKKSRGGTGLGLPIARRIVEYDHRGTLSIESKTGEGTKVILILPINNQMVIL